MQAYLTKDGDIYTAVCPHATVNSYCYNDPHAPEDDEIRTRHALQRHSSLCERPCMLPLWLEWYETRRQRFLAAGIKRAHG